jgi:hypothetical protein
MHVCYGWARKTMSLSLEQRYHPEQLMARLGPYCQDKVGKVVSPLVWMPVWIHMDNHYVRLNTKAEVELACKLACIYHNGPDNRAPFRDDDWHYITGKEAFLAGTRTPESDSDDEVGLTN